MQIKKSCYLLTAVKPEQFPEATLPAITLVGRSNVGKSSLINTLCNKRGMARTSSQPGKTRTINFYLLDEKWYFVDLPGYGYAKVSKSEREDWRRMVNSYITRYNGAKMYWQLVDIRHSPTAQDKEMWEWLKVQGLSATLVVTKSDKISRGAQDKHLAAICRELGVAKSEMMIFSAVDRTGKDALLAVVEAFLTQHGVLSRAALPKPLKEEKEEQKDDEKPKHANECK